ncbi:hypothetical protein [Streptomyces sp. NPDC093970]|uniref:hypothetical protein n=1 Tax=Streptomyces sp. NPDC093970 TaxID=3155076 RepID=UPI00341A3B34
MRYELLRRALVRSVRVAVTKCAWSGRERLGLLCVREYVIVLYPIRRPDGARDSAGVNPLAAHASDAGIDEAVELIERMTTDRLEGPALVDHCTEPPERGIEAKREDHALPEAPEPKKPAGKVFDLMAAVQESVDKAKSLRGENTGTDAGVRGMPARKATAKAPEKKGQNKPPVRTEQRRAVKISAARG